MSVKDLKKYLKTLDKEAIARLLDAIGASDAKRHIIIRCYCYDEPIKVICNHDGFNLSESAAYKYHREIMTKLCNYLAKNRSHQ